MYLYYPIEPLYNPEAELRAQLDELSGKIDGLQVAKGGNGAFRILGVGLKRV